MPRKLIRVVSTDEFKQRYFGGKVEDYLAKFVPALMSCDLVGTVIGRSPVVANSADRYQIGHLFNIRPCVKC